MIKQKGKYLKQIILVLDYNNNWNIFQGDKRIKLGWRNVKSTTTDKAKNMIDKYFKKVKKFIDNELPKYGG